jgi:hypothetical protein
MAHAIDVLVYLGSFRNTNETPGGTVVDCEDEECDIGKK